MTHKDKDERTRTAHLAQLGALLAGFAHEIRNPLSTIGLNLQLIKEDFADAEETRDRRTFKRLTTVENEVQRLQSILEEFLGFVRTPSPRRKVVDLNQLLQSLVDFHVPEMRAAGVSLQFFPGPLDGQVELDADQFRAAIVNLLRNARDACEEGGEVLLSSRGVGDEVLIQITDSGAGMEPSVVERAFQPYFSTKKGGTGLGLALARRIVEEHGGSMDVSSEPGKGTQFSLRFPMSAGDAGGDA